MLFNVICCNDRDTKLLARYFDSTTPTKVREMFEGKLLRLAYPKWDKLKLGNADELIISDHYYVILRQVGQLRILVSGKDDYDELIMQEFMNVLCSALSMQLDKKMTEASFLANYDKVMIILDEMVQFGHWETTEETMIDIMSKLRPYPTKA